MVKVRGFFLSRLLRMVKDSVNLIDESFDTIIRKVLRFADNFGSQSVQTAPFW